MDSWKLENRTHPMGTLGQAPPSKDHWITPIQKVVEKKLRALRTSDLSFLKLGGGWTNPLEKILVKLEIFPK